MTSLAASAAADLLSFGDYAIAFDGSTLLYHGTRTSSDLILTAAAATNLIAQLKGGNQRYALELARRSRDRFFWIYVNLRPLFPALRQEFGSPDLPDLDCLLELLSRRLSENGLHVLKAGRERNSRYSDLSKAVFSSEEISSIIDSTHRERFAELEAAVLKRIVAFELDANQDPDWRFSQTGLSQLTDDFLLFTEYIGHHNSERLKSLQRWSPFLLTQAELDEVSAAPPETQADLQAEKLNPIIRPIWLFFAAICHSLQEGEYILPATDAFWLGLIDEVQGRVDLPTLRLVLEYQPET